MNEIQTYRDLKIWQRSFDLAVQIYNATRNFPEEEKYGLIAQIRRCAVSVPSNIAEGYARNTTKDYVRYLRIAIGSLCELQTQVLISARLNYLNKDLTVSLEREMSEIEKMTAVLISRLLKKR